jgi:hypothetical protein
MSLSFKQISRRIPGIAALDCQTEQHSEPRIYGFFPALVRGVDASGERFQVHTLLDNFGAEELYLRLLRRVRVGERLFILTDIHEASIALHGRVLRLEPQPDGACDVTVAIRHHRFI